MTGKDLNDAVDNYRRCPFIGKFAFHKLNKLEGVILDSDKNEIMRGRAIKVLWIFKAMTEKMAKDSNK